MLRGLLVLLVAISLLCPLVSARPDGKEAREKARDLAPREVALQHADEHSRLAREAAGREERHHPSSSVFDADPPPAEPSPGTSATSEPVAQAPSSPGFETVFIPVSEPQAQPVLPDQGPPMSAIVAQELLAPANGGGPMAASTPEPVVNHREWIGGLLNATQQPDERASQPQGLAAPIASSPLLLLVFGIGVGASTAVVGVRRFVRRAQEPSAPTKPGPAGASRPALSVLVERVSRAPLDAMAAFQLGVELLKLGVESDGLRLLDRSIRINPLLIVQLLQEPAYQRVRSAPGVQRLLVRVKRDYDRRLTTGYA